MIEMISMCREPRSAATRVPVLFVPGALSGAWIWRRNSMAAFVEVGH